MRILTGLSGSLLVLALTLTGCASKDACTLLAAGDLEAAFGRPFGDGKPTHQEDTGADQCAWTSTDAAPGVTFSITVLSQDRLAGAFKTSGMTLAELFEQSKLAYPNAEAVDLGDAAYAAVGEVQVLDGGAWYSLSVHGAGDGAVGGLKELAERVAGRP
ncbi:hypothetical protein [Nonomuraea typhae]|uniref:DUF3558 domain-containing protein n=1 Tax=Nonomuraea typhae TaxID=2603600 RepID=A0ABW7ZB13_9ACTN